MFTLEDIRAAHSKVKSGADFPGYIQDLKRLGVIRYNTYVHDGHTVYFGDDGCSIVSAAQYQGLAVADHSSPHQFAADLKAHQQGKTDYRTFCNDCARSGVEQWEVSIETMTCTYFAIAGDTVLMEQIPE